MQPQSRTRQVNHRNSKDNRADVQVIFRPYWLENPYQKLLIEQLVKLGVQIEAGSSSSSLMTGKVDILHLHWLHSFFAAPNTLKSLINTLKFIGKLVWLRLTGVKIVWTAHNLKDHENRYPFLDRICTTLVAKLAHAIIAHCQAAKCEIVTTLKLKNPDKIFVVPHGNYSGYYENKIERLEARRILGIPNSRFVFLFLGWIRPYKGVFDLLAAFKQLHSQELQLVLAGKTLNDDELTTQMRQKTAGHDNIKFIPGFVPDDQIQVYLNACDVVVFPYRDVLTSGAAILAMSFGKTCIAPRMGCIQEILDDSGAFLYDPDVEAGLFEAMNNAWQNSPDLLRMGEHNQKLADQWSWDIIAAKTLDVYLQCLR